MVKKREFTEQEITEFQIQCRIRKQNGRWAKYPDDWDDAKRERYQQWIQQNKMVGYRKRLRIEKETNPVKYQKREEEKKEREKATAKEIPQTYPCNTCDYVAKRSSDLKRHLKTHTGDKPHVCRYCDFAFAQVGNLKIHERTHTGEKPYKCDYKGCDYASTNGSDLGHHKRTHTGEKPYKCDCVGCSFEAAHPSTLRRHKKAHALPYSNGTSRIACRWMDSLQKEFMISIQHVHHDLFSGKCLGAEFRPKFCGPVDGWDKKENVCYEFLGDQWHGHPRLWTKGVNHLGISFQELFKQTKSKFDKLVVNGYKVVYVWESDYKQACKRICKISSVCFIYDGELKHN